MVNKVRRRSRARLEERERAILGAATELFASAGFHATSTRKIAAAAGVSEGTIFHYFGSKNELMLGILDHFYNDVLNPHAAEILDTVMDTRGRLHSMALHHVTSLAADSALMMRLLQVYVGVDLEYLGQSQDSPIRSLNRRYVGYLDRIVREGIERGEIRKDVDTRLARDLYFGTLEYGMRTHLYRHGAQGLDSHVGLLLEPIWRSLAAANAAPGTEEHLSARLETACSRLEAVAQALEDQ
ncbi:MAG: TetR/AcrR family fatty acid metabolism transcriptional regulator [Halieaceae bacterium]|jgi:TetR/AcrR family fatty acid metabolism transcriptional regulator